MPLTPLVLASLAATWIVWGSTYLAIRFALVSLPPFLQMASRFLVAGALLLAWMVLLRRAALPSARQWWHALLVGALMLGGGMGGTAYAEQTIQAISIAPATRKRDAICRNGGRLTSAKRIAR